MYEVYYSPTAQNALKAIHASDHASEIEEIFVSVREIKKDPYAHAKMLIKQNKLPLFSLYVGKYRIIMVIEDDQQRVFEDDHLKIFVIKIDHSAIL